MVKSLYGVILADCKWKWVKGRVFSRPTFDVMSPRHCGDYEKKLR